MKKIYTSIFTAGLLLSSFLSQGQVTYTSITSNPLGYTLDDANFWQGGTGAPLNPCTDCTIKIYADVKMVQNGFSTVAAYNCGGCTFLNDVVLNNSTINVYGNTTLAINTYLELFDSQITIGNDPTSTEVIKLNDQVDLNGTSSITLANDLTSVNAIDTTTASVNPIIGPHEDFFNAGVKSPGLYAIIPPDVNGYDYTWLLDFSGIGTSSNQYQPAPNIFHYILNCAPNVPLSSNLCADGFIFGPATTSLDPTYGLIFIQNTVLPVVLVQFLATKNDDGSVKLSWATSQEQNSDYYEIERSGDQTAWIKIGSVKAKGYSSTTSNYSYKDRSPLDGNSYYRLKMVDLDGKFKYSKTVSVSSDRNAQPLVIYSNPFSDLIRMKVNVARAQNLTMTVSDMMGKTYVSKSYQAHTGDNFVNLQPGVGGSGMYILRIQGDSFSQTVKLEKQ